MGLVVDGVRAWAQFETEPEQHLRDGCTVRDVRGNRRIRGGGDLSDGDVSDRGLASGTGVTVGDLSDIDVSVRGLVSDPPGVSLVTGVVFGSSPVSE